MTDLLVLLGCALILFSAMRLITKSPLIRRFRIYKIGSPINLDMNTVSKITAIWPFGYMLCTRSKMQCLGNGNWEITATFIQADPDIRIIGE